ncbi:hypothetical protein AB2T96_19140 [Clostridium butyricum]|uniref:hypothetical protein n=1 Tax=Clostridium butyricum TaxID=1492 RepID=UPI0034654CF5
MKDIIISLIYIIIGALIYLKIDKRYNISTKINKLFYINRKRRAYVLATTIWIIGTIIFLSVCHIESIPDKFTYIVSYLFWGVINCISERIISQFNIKI